MLHFYYWFYPFLYTFFWYFLVLYFFFGFVGLFIFLVGVVTDDVTTPFCVLSTSGSLSGSSSENPDQGA
jgi:hypothetical protein